MLVYNILVQIFIVEFKQFKTIAIDDYNAIHSTVSIWIDYRAFHRVVLCVPHIPLMKVGQSTHERPSRKQRSTRTGVVESYSWNKTIKVRRSYITQHRKYKKYVRKVKTYLVHDEYNIAKKGNIVEIAECRHISKSKYHRLTSIVAYRVINTSLDES